MRIDMHSINADALDRLEGPCSETSRFVRRVVSVLRYADGSAALLQAQQRVGSNPELVEAVRQICGDRAVEMAATALAPKIKKKIKINRTTKRKKQTRLGPSPRNHPLKCPAGEEGEIERLEKDVEDLRSPFAGDETADGGIRTGKQTGRRTSPRFLLSSCAPGSARRLPGTRTGLTLSTSHRHAFHRFHRTARRPQFWRR